MSNSMKVVTRATSIVGLLSALRSSPNSQVTQIVPKIPGFTNRGLSRVQMEQMEERS